MQPQELLIAPFYLAFFYLWAHIIRKRVTNRYTRQYFLPALTLKFIGAIALGLIYQFYYGGGDTFNYYGHATVIHEAFQHSFTAGMKLLLTSGGAYDPETIRYTANMYWYQEGSSEYLLARIAAVFGLLCFNSYVVIGLFFALLSFSGVWAMYITFAAIRPSMYKQLAWTLFFIPSLFFWGSGLLKDSLCFGALGWLFYALYRGAIMRRKISRNFIIGFITAYLLFYLKVYILLCFLPAALLWVFNETNSRIKSQTMRLLARPVLLGLGGVLAFYATTNLTEGDAKYDLDNIGERSKITADYLYQQSQLQEGSGYYLGELDGSIGSMVKLAPQAIGTALFRPFVWEAHNPVMLLSALEALFILGFTLRILYRTGLIRTLGIITRTPILVLCFVFGLTFAASVGVTSNNFGTLVRYKIPMIPFYLGGLFILQDMAAIGHKSKPKSTSLKSRQLAGA